jgi:hypothetical protein
VTPLRGARAFPALTVVAFAAGQKPDSSLLTMFLVQSDRSKVILPASLAQ